MRVPRGYFLAGLALVVTSGRLTTLASEAAPSMERPTASSRLLERYEARRESQLEVSDEKLAIAHRDLTVWCKQNHLPLRMRAHAIESLRRNPDQPGLQRILGRIRVGDRFMDADQWRTQRADAIKAETSIRRFEKRLQKIARSSHLSADTLGHALRRISDPAAIDAMTRMVLTESDAAATAGLEWLAARDEPEAILAIARVAVFDDRLGLRKSAIRALADVDPFSYVPSVLAWCEGSVEVRHQLLTSSAGMLAGIQRQLTTDEGVSQKRHIHTTSVRYTVPDDLGPNPVAAIDDLQTLLGEASRDEQWLRDSAAQLNDRAELIARRAAMVLRQLDDSIAMESSKGDLVRWWYALHRYDVGTASSMPMTLTQSSDSMIRQLGNDLVSSQSGTTGDMLLVDGPTSSGTGRPGPTRSVQRSFQNQNVIRPMNQTVPAAGECLLAGTSIMTDQGLRPIESLRIGDVVLSCNVQTGDISHQPILKTTTRPPSGLVALNVDGETIVASPGHPFWVIGTGWVMAGDLVRGQTLRTARGSAIIRGTATADVAETHNLLVDHNQSYFVGRSGLLSHDVQLRQTAVGPIPGSPVTLTNVTPQ
ncbi:MAG: polymorphic toxin-type HINT domain-containing protein [Planctomycetota bacterium]